MNHKRYIRAKLREMGNSTLFANQDTHLNESKNSYYNIKSEQNAQNTTLLNTSPENRLYANEQVSPKDETKYMNFKGKSVNQSQRYNNTSSNYQSLDKKMDTSILRTSQTDKLNSTERFSKVRFENQETIDKYNCSRDDDLYVKNHMSLSIKQLNERLLEQTKKNKVLERDLKEKTDMIKRLTLKLDKQKQEMSILTEKFNHEKNMNVRIEMSNLSKKLQQKEYEVEEINQSFEDIINEYKVSLENCINVNHNTQTKLKELENLNKSLFDQNEELNKKNSNTEKKLRDIYDDLEVERKHKGRIDHKCKSLNQSIKGLIEMIISFSKNKEFVHIQRQIIDNLSNLFKNDKTLSTENNNI